MENMDVYDGMMLVADSGSTKTDLRLIGNGTVLCCIATQGLNPVHQSEEDISEVVLSELIPQLQGNAVSRVFFYGAGCRGDAAERMQKCLAKVFMIEEAKVEANSDLLGAARSVCGEKAGIACILGTGSNSCVYDGKEIISNIPPLGYILGDEGSGAVLGRMFLNAVFKNESLSNLRDEYLKWAGLTYDDIIKKVYREPMANRFLATTSLFISKHLDNSDVCRIIKDNFLGFFRNNVIRYNRGDLLVNAVGSIAFHYRELFCETAREEGFEVGNIIKSPIEGLVKYHS